MSTFHELLLSGFERGGFSAEDALASFLPLARQVAQAHAAGKVAPLEGTGSLQVEGTRAWFHETAAQDPRSNLSSVKKLDKQVSSVEILGEHKRTIDVDDGPENYANLQIGKRDHEITKPVYLPGYVCWEHQIGHHDPLSDVFSLGMIFASLACSLDFNQPDDLELFVSQRRNLFHLNDQLHPVLAKAIVRMTELSRHNRPQDLPTLIRSMENYRDQNVDFDFDLASAEAGAAAGTRKQVILGKLQERLFEISRRNHLLHFRSTLNAVNLTHASVPLSFDVQNIRPEQILTWGGDFAHAVSAGEPVSLSRHLNFTEQIYLPSVLDRIRADARRDAAEFGFQQLRLAVCFLRWANVKETPPDHYDSPLVLLSVGLVKKKGVRDSYWLQPLTSEAEINPVVRHLFKQLYDIDLPVTIELSESALDQLYDDLAGRITASEPGITLNKVDRPRIELIHDQAKRRLDRYRRTARVSGRGIRSFLEVDYSYDPANFHPLGLALFRAKIRPGATHLREIVQDKPTPRSHFAEPPQDGVPVAEKERQFYALCEEADDNPFNWDFDLCRVTLGNFRYRKMTLVRDYAELLDDGLASPAFDSVFSLVPRPVELDAPTAPLLDDRFHIVQCDPTQAAAIGLARTGASYIIQGPPGTGKSQTITNLVADYVMRGKRILFVCEKRAAIDVVFARLRQRGLHPLCCLIHDSQADKKEFVLDLKATYEGLLAEQQAKPRTWHKRRLNLLKALQQELEPLEQFDQSMRAAAPGAGVSTRQLLERAIELAGSMPPLSPAEKELLPDYALWAGNAETIGHLVVAIQEVQPDGVFASHPLRLLSSRIADSERPIQFVTSSLRTARQLLTSLTAAMTSSGIPENQWQTLAGTLGVLRYAVGVECLARRKWFALLDEQSTLSRDYGAASTRHADALQAHVKAQEATKNWNEKLAPDDLENALDQAKAAEGKLFAWLSPAWWRLRKVLRARYRFDAHAIRPRWSQVLTALDSEYKSAAALAEAERSALEQLGANEPLDVIGREVEQARQFVREMPQSLRPLHEVLLESDGAPEVIARLVGELDNAERLQETCAAFLEDFASKPLGDFGDGLEHIERSLDILPDFLFCLGQLAQLPPALAAAFRSLPLDARRLEAAIVARCIDELFRTDRTLNRFNGTVRDGHARRLDRLCRTWYEANAAAVLEKAREGFVEHIRVASLPAAQLTNEQKEFKAVYNRGRRGLEHEFGKVMRYKSIRDIVGGESGSVVSDLKPIWLMSPLSVSDTLPLETDAFDVVIFDEASQVTLEEAVPSIFRAAQTIVVGDEMQLPPTNFFSAKSVGEDEEGLMLSEDGQVFEYDLSSNSLLNHAAKNLPARMLGWHYRSRSESLISFSNWAFYQGKLLTVPEERIGAAGGTEIIAQSTQDGSANVAHLVDRPVSFHFIQRGVYDNRRNRAEAAYIAELVLGLLSDEKPLSIGIVAFSEAQQREIEGSLSDLAADDKEFADRLEAEIEREIDGQHVGLLVKNLENIQGDERDVIILSVCYGHAPDGKMRMNFGPINQSGGEKRLNVAFSRAKHHMAVVSSIRHTDITNDYNDGANCLKSYLHYAAACSAGDAPASQQVLHKLAVWRDAGSEEPERRDAAVQDIVAALRERGYAVDIGVGMSMFRCDIAARRHGEPRYRLGVLVDTETHYQQADLLEREMMRPQLLRTFGWQVAHVLLRDWYTDRESVLDRLVRVIEQGEEPAPAEPPEEQETEDAWAEFDGPEEEEPPAPTASPDEAGSVPGFELEKLGPPKATPPVPLNVQAGPFKRHFEFVRGASSKFWEIALSGNTITVRFGRIGANGQTQQKILADDDVAARAASGLIRQKLRKGYIEKPASPPQADNSR